jgi:hypothetical protein
MAPFSPSLPERRTWIETGMPSRSASAQNGSSSRERFMPPDGHAMIVQPFMPIARVRRSSASEPSRPVFGMSARPIKRFGATAQNSWCSQLL